MKYFQLFCFNNYFADGDTAVVESFGVVGVDSGTLQILDSSALTNFICVLLGLQNCLICSCVTICGVAFTLASLSFHYLYGIVGPILLKAVLLHLGLYLFIKYWRNRKVSKLGSHFARLFLFLTHKYYLFRLIDGFQLPPEIIAVATTTKGIQEEQDEERRLGRVGQ